MPRQRSTPGPRARAVTAFALAASTVAIGSASADPTPAAQVVVHQAAPAPDPALLAAIRQQTSPQPALISTLAPSPTTVPKTSPSQSRSTSRTRSAPGRASAMAAPGMPAAALAAYKNSQAALARSRPACRLPWTLLAGIGTVESDNGRYAGATLGADGVVSPAIIGIPLNGSTPGTSVVHDTDHGRWDGDPVYDHAVGPMQFLPGTWAAVGTSATPGDAPNPENINDAALSAGIYLCDSGDDLATVAGQRAAVLTYNDSATYADTVLALSDAYAAGLLDPIITSPQQPTTAAAKTTTPPTVPTKPPVTSPSAKIPGASPTASPSDTSTPTATPTASPSDTSTPTSSDPASPEPGAAPGGVVDETVRMGTAPRTLFVTWDPPVGGVPPSSFIVTWQQFEAGTWHPVDSGTVAASATTSESPPLQAGTYRASVVTVGATGQSDPVTSTRFTLEQP